MSQILSVSEILSKLYERVRRIENDASQVAGILSKMIARIEERKKAGTGQTGQKKDSAQKNMG